MKNRWSHMSYLGNALAICLLLGWWIVRTEPASPSAVSSTSTPAGSSSTPSALPNHLNKIEPADIGDIEKTVQKLRAVGTPPEVIQDVIATTLRRHYAELRNRVLYPPGAPRWQQRVANLSPDQEMEMERLRQQFEADMRRYLGPDYRDGVREHQTRLVSTLPAVKSAQVAQIVSDYQAATRLVGGGLKTADERLEVEKQLATDLKKVLTPAEFDDYMAYDSMLARSLQQRLSGLDIDDATYRRVYQAMSGTREAYLRSGKSAAALHSFEYMLIEADAIRVTAGDIVAAHVISQQKNGFDGIAAILRESGDLPSTIVQKHEAYLRFHSDMEQMRDTQPREQRAAHSLSIAKRTYGTITAGMSETARDRFEATATGRFLKGIIARNRQGS